MGPVPNVPRGGEDTICALKHAKLLRQSMYTGLKRPKLVWPEGRRRIPLVVARQVDVLPAQRRQMGKISGCRMVPLLSQVIDSPLQIGPVPQNDGSDGQIQTVRGGIDSHTSGRGFRRVG
jgi:hypothetical protein